MNPEHRHWTVIGFNGITEDEKGYKLSCDITLYDVQTEEEALSRARSLVKRKEYVVARITDCISCPHFLEQYHIQKSAVEMMQKHNYEE